MLILASASPRRSELLKLITEDFSVHVADVDEHSVATSTPNELVEKLAELKATAVAKDFPNDVTIGADTIVALDGEILGKPTDETDARRMLETLSGKKHQVFTGIAIITPQRTVVFSVSTDVAFERLSKDEITDYLKTGEPFDKAGAYGIQGYASKFVKGICGDYFNIVGLPVNRLYYELKNLDCLDDELKLSHPSQ